MNKRVKEILSWYTGESPGILTNSFQRPRAEALEFLGTIMNIYAGKVQ